MTMRARVISLVALCASLTVLAQEPPRPAAGGGLAERFKQYDKNGDGKLTFEEVGVPTAVEIVKTLDVRYAEVPSGVDANLLSLDIYAPKDAKNAPVIMFIHGGGWRTGDKANSGVGSRPAAHFCAQGFVFVSINYRLTPAGRHPANIQDVAKAVAWVHDHIAEHGGDPAQINIMGHSAGAHLAALVSTDETRLKAEGKPLSILKRAILLDTAAYDILRYLTEFQEARGTSPMRQLYMNAFGDTEEQWRDASPQAHVAPGKHIPPMLLFFTGSRMAANTLAPAFAEALTEAGAPSRAVDTITLTHREIGLKAADKDHPLGQLVLRFLKGEDATSFPGRLDIKAAPAASVSSPSTPKPDANTMKVASETTSPLRFAFTKDYFPGANDRSGPGEIFVYCAVDRKEPSKPTIHGLRRCRTGIMKGDGE